MIFVTGGAGFIGTNFINEYAKRFDDEIINLDSLTYAGNFGNFDNKKALDNRLINIQGDINNLDLVKNILLKYQPTKIFHFAAESHVDRSIAFPINFINSNIIGTFNLLSSVKDHIEENSLDLEEITFYHVSTDEVFGTLDLHDLPFTEDSQYRPNSPYSASKASSDHIVRSFRETYGIKAIITNCSNNFGPYQSPEKLIPLVIYNALDRKDIPIYGNGKQIRDWLYVKDHVNALLSIASKTNLDHNHFCIGGSNELPNIDLVKLICILLDDLKPHKKGPYQNLIKFVNDRKGHDFRYGIDSSLVTHETGWKPNSNFNETLEETIKWYLKNEEWLSKMKERL